MIWTRGKERAKDVHRNDLLRLLCLLGPERGHCGAQQTGMHIRCGSTACSLAILPRKRPDTYRHKKTLGRAPVSPDIAGPCPAEPFQLVPIQLCLISAGIHQLKACESPPIRGLLTTVILPRSEER